MKTIMTCLLALVFGVSVRGADDIKIKGSDGIRPIRATTNVMDIGGVGWETGEEQGEYLVRDGDGRPGSGHPRPRQHRFRVTCLRDRTGRYPDYP